MQLTRAGASVVTSSCVGDRARAGTFLVRLMVMSQVPAELIEQEEAAGLYSSL